MKYRVRTTQRETGRCSKNKKKQQSKLKSSGKRRTLLFLEDYSESTN